MPMMQEIFVRFGSILGQKVKIAVIYRMTAKI